MEAASQCAWPTTKMNLMRPASWQDRPLDEQHPLIGRQLLIGYTLYIIVIGRTMPEEILTVVRLPLADLSEEIRRKHKLSEALVDSRIEGEVLVMYFARTPRSSSPMVPVRRAAEVLRLVRSV